MKKKVIVILFIICSILFSLFIYDSITIKKDESDLSLIVPNYKSTKIKEELLSVYNSIIPIIMNDPKDGYTIGLDTPSLSKKGIKDIYNELKVNEICINDEQGYFDLENKHIFDDFYKNYLSKNKCSFILYTIQQTGDVIRKEYVYNGKMFYVIYSNLNIDDYDNPVIEYIYGREILDANYDEYGYFYYHIDFNEIYKRYGAIEYEYINVSPLGEKSREYTRKYLHTIDYQCSNIFNEEWDSQQLEKVNFSDLFEYLYQIKYNKPYYAENATYSSNPFVKEIPGDFFESIIKEFFNIDEKFIRECSVYNKEKHSYLWREAYCVVSKFETPSYKGEVIDYEEKDNILILTVYANGYEYGYSYGYMHKIYIQKENYSFKYIGNEIIHDTNDKIPCYSPGVECGQEENYY